MSGICRPILEFSEAISFLGCVVAQPEEAPARPKVFGSDSAQGNQGFHPSSVQKFAQDLSMKEKSVYRLSHCTGQIRNQIVSTIARRRRTRGVLPKKIGERHYLIF